MYILCYFFNLSYDFILHKLKKIQKICKRILYLICAFSSYLKSSTQTIKNLNRITFFLLMINDAWKMGENIALRNHKIELHRRFHKTPYDKALIQCVRIHHSHGEKVI